MRYTILIAALLTGCGGGSSTPIATAPIEVVSPPVEVVVPPNELTCPKVIPCPPEVTCPVIEDPVEPKPVYVLSRIELDEDGDGRVC